VGIYIGGLLERQVLLHHANDHAGDDVDENDQKAGDRVAADEFRRTVHGPEEGAFLFQGRTAQTGFLFVDQAGGKIGVNRHLFSGHSIQAETCCDFGDTGPHLW
jgi:hypothetical protein